MALVMLAFAAAALAVVVLLRHRARIDARWRPAGLRTIVGMDHHREVALPPMLSRDVEPLPATVIVVALRCRNLDARRRHNRIDIATADGLAIRLRAQSWTPTTIQMTILDGYRPQTAVVVATLASLFGPIEYTSPHGTIVAYDSGGAITSGPLSDTVW
jgi:hypothetical protein